ncbi:MAG: DNA cytosine methyltransferase [Bacteroidetes bacterium]|nr:DNA cytosine methyltransferase [Bacteroidota bacterium]
MNILIACEFSGIVRDAFKAKGHNAWSCDISPTESRGNHIQGDVLNYLNAGWDMMIAHPPCTYLAVSGARWWKDHHREQKEAIEFFMKLVNAPIDRICVENPVGKMSTEYRKPEQYIQPWEFGCGETKKTGLWLKNLPQLEPTNIVSGRIPRIHYMAPGKDRSKNRSRTYKVIAKAMADQWG